MDMSDAGLSTGAVCVYPNRVADCVQLLKRSALSTGLGRNNNLQT